MIYFIFLFVCSKAIIALFSWLEPNICLNEAGILIFLIIMIFKVDLKIFNKFHQILLLRLKSRCEQRVANVESLATTSPKPPHSRLLCSRFFGLKAGYQGLFGSMPSPHNHSLWYRQLCESTATFSVKFSQSETIINIYLRLGL